MMDEKTYQSLKEIIASLEYSMDTNDFSYFILNPNKVNPELSLIRKWVEDKEDNGHE